MSRESEMPTRVSERGCDHRDMAGDSLVEVSGDHRRCSACGLHWRDTEIVIVNDEVAHGS
jgi:hypothetical protein